MDLYFNNENDPWEFSLDIDDFDLNLTPVLRPSSSTRVEPSPSISNSVRIIPASAGIVQQAKPSGYCPNPVRIIPGPACIVQQVKLLKEKVFILDSDGALMSTQEYMQKVVEDVGEDDDFNGGSFASVIADIVSDTQSAFIADRQILDGPFILNEVIHWCKRLNKKAMFFKVDFAKAYDSVRWDYLLDVLEAFGFGSIWCKWIRGDGLFHGIRLNRSLVLTHLFYADDALFIGEWSEVGECMSRSKAWDGIILKLRSRLSKWKAKTLSICGRFTLLKAVLGASPLYTMSIFKAPLGVLKKMESIRNKFFRGADLGDNKMTWIAWDKVLASKERGGLG
nr:hypothetical protein [Tanacetum cinerariifolium]